MCFTSVATQTPSSAIVPWFCFLPAARRFGLLRTGGLGNRPAEAWNQRQECDTYLQSFATDKGASAFSRCCLRLSFCWSAWWPSHSSYQLPCSSITAIARTLRRLFLHNASWIRCSISLSAVVLFTTRY